MWDFGSRGPEVDCSNKQQDQLSDIWSGRWWEVVLRSVFFAAEKKERKSSSVGRWAKELVRTKYIVLSRSQKYVVEI